MIATQMATAGYLDGHFTYVDAAGSQVDRMLHQINPAEVRAAAQL